MDCAREESRRGTKLCCLFSPLKIARLVKAEESE